MLLYCFPAHVILQGISSSASIIGRLGGNLTPADDDDSIPCVLQMGRIFCGIMACRWGGRIICYYGMYCALSLFLELRIS
jgi:hypothetical protein